MGVISKKMMKTCLVFYIEQKMEFEKVNCFFSDFLRYSFGRIKVISTVVETVVKLIGFYMIRGFTKQYS